MATKSQWQDGYLPLPGLLRQLREEAGHSQRALADRLKKPQSWVHNCEVRNRRVDVSEFCDWCRECEVSPEVGLRRFLAASKSRR